MRIIHPSLYVSVVFLDDINAKVNIFYEEDKVIIMQPQSYGGKLEKSLSDYDNYDGDLRAWVLSFRKTGANDVCR